MITVVIPLYNKETSVSAAVESVLNQSFQDFEIVVVDDGSTDSGAYVVKSMTDSRIRLIHQPNGGVSKARNTGIREARGRYIAFLDADDEWDKDYLSKIWELIEKYPECKARATNYKLELSGQLQDTVLRKIPFEGDGVLYNYFEIGACSHPPVWTSCTCIDKDILLSIGGFPEGVRSGEDLLTWARVAMKTDFAYSMEPLGLYKMDDSYVLTSTPSRRQDDGDPVGRGLEQLLTENPSKPGLKSYISRWHKMRASTAIRFFNRYECFRETCLSLRFDMCKWETYPFLILPILPKCVLLKLFARK